MSPGTPNQYFLLSMYSPSCHLFIPCHWTLKPSRFKGDCPFWGTFSWFELFLAFWRPTRGPLGPQTNISQFVCVVLVILYLSHAIWGLNHLDSSGYNKIYSLIWSILRLIFPILGLFGLLKAHEGPLGTQKQQLSVSMYSTSYLPIPCHLKLKPA